MLRTILFLGLLAARSLSAHDWVWLSDDVERMVDRSQLPLAIWSGLRDDDKLDRRLTRAGLTNDDMSYEALLKHLMNLEKKFLITATSADTLEYRVKRNHLENNFEYVGENDLQRSISIIMAAIKKSKKDFSSLSFMARENFDDGTCAIILYKIDKTKRKRVKVTGKYYRFVGTR